MDKYTKVVLSIIAAALMLLAVQNLTTPARASGGSCGSVSYDPCYVKVV